MTVLALWLEEAGEFEKAETWYRRAAEAGYARAMFDLGYVLARRDALAEAEDWYRRAAAQGDPNAMTNLGLMLQKRGEHAEAQSLFRRAEDIRYYRPFLGGL
ncbi:tetratricopeptide repeat protein [Nocardia xishanensis]|uniref:tetratricopeptide repeat protein n=1 Tax=Nocardia xishanensis TaxID=238964 RepID=UPI0008328A66|nr:tetratricopeptide repeat protein [Nocardia xishanensis]